MLDLPEGLCKVAGIRKAAVGTDLADLHAGGKQQLGGLFNAVLLDILDGCDPQQLPEAAQAGALTQGHAVGNALHVQFLSIMLFHKTQHLFHALGRDLLLLRDLCFSTLALHSQQMHRRRKMVPRLILIVKDLLGHCVPDFPQMAEHGLLPVVCLVQQKERRCSRLKQRVYELLPEDGIHAADQARMEYPGMQQGIPGLSLLHRMEHSGIDKHALPGLQNQPGFAHVHRQRAFYGKDVFKLFMPMPRYRVAFEVLFIAGNRKQCAAVLHQFPALVIRHNILQAVEPAHCCTAGLKCHDQPSPFRQGAHPHPRRFCCINRAFLS